MPAGTGSSFFFFVFVTGQRSVVKLLQLSGRLTVKICGTCDMQVILVRHGTHAEVGKVLSGRSEIALSPRGQAEAAVLADVLSDLPLASLHASPRRRARETIVPLAERLQLPVRIAAALDEIDFGRFTGRTFTALDEDRDWFRWNAERGTARCPDGETMAEATARAVAYIKALTPEDFPALCVTHCDVIRGIVTQQLELGLDRLFAIDCDPASRTTLDFASHSTRLVALNERVRPCDPPE